MPNQPDASDKQAAPKADKRCSEPQPAVLKAEDDTKVTSKSTSEAQEATKQAEIPPQTPGRFRRAWNWTKKKCSEASLADWAMVLFTFIIAASTIVFTVYAGRQWHEMRDGGTQTDKIIAADERIAKAMESTATRASEALEANIDASRLDQRAWLTIAGFEKTVFTIGQRFKVRGAIKNAGKTPAIEVHLMAVIEPLKKGIDPDLLKVYKGKAKGLVPPADLLYFDLDGTEGKNLSQIGYDLIKIGDQVIWVHGIAAYTDVFGSKHWTKFCDVFNPTTGDMDLCTMSGSNEIDREPKKKNPN